MRDKAPRDKDGKVIDPNTNLPTDNPVYGHRTGLENRRLVAEAERRGLTQSEFNDFVNDNADKIFQMEDKASNLSHQFELPGNGPSSALDSLPWPK